MSDYNNSQIYKIVSPNHDKVYYGSTTDKLSKRFSNHKSKLTCLSREIINAGNADIKHIEWFPCDNKHALEDREAYFILNDRDGCVNKEVPGAVRRAGGMKAYNQKPEIKAQKKAYNNKPEVKAHNNKPVQCTCGKWSTMNHIKRHQKSNKCKKIIETEVMRAIESMILILEN